MIYPEANTITQLQKHVRHLNHAQSLEYTRNLKAQNWIKHWKLRDAMQVLPSRRKLPSPICKTIMCSTSAVPEHHNTRI